jgi:hypothetical protein
MARVEGFEVGNSGMQPVDVNGNPLAVGVWGDSDAGMGVFGTSGQLPPGTTTPGGDPAGVVGNSVQNSGVLGRSAQNFGVVGQSQDSIGVLGQSQNNPGVLGTSGSPASSGVVAANLAGGDGVSAFVGDGNAVFGSSRRTGTGAFGGNFPGLDPNNPNQFLPATGIGVSGFCQDTGIGVQGTCHNHIGVRGDSDNHVGMRGRSQAGIGVRGSSAQQGNNVNGGIGIHGIGTNGATAVAGISQGGIGVLARSTGIAAGLFQGNVFVTGALFANGKFFKIEHPLDPENQYLVHATVESPDMKTIYDGVVTLDPSGAATVSLPEWFEALNKDFRYQLTPIGGPGPDLHIAEEIAGNQFTIGGGAPGAKVSWQVTGIRQDSWAQAHPVAVEQDKRTEEPIRLLYAESPEQLEAISRWIEEDQAETEALMSTQNQRIAELQERMERQDFPATPSQ